MSGRASQYRRFLMVAAAALALLGLPRPGLAAPGDPLLDYNVDLVSDYVSRGVDQFVINYDKDGKAHGAFNSAPALQPSFTLHGPAGFWFNMWGSFAATSRSAAAPSAADPAGFPGLKVLDEIDYTLAKDWSNKLGSFSAGWIVYTYPDSAQLLLTNSELYIKYAPPILPALGPSITHYIAPDVGTSTYGGTYTTVGIGGGDAFKWKFSLGETTKLKDVTGGVSYSMGAFTVALTAAYRPHAEIVSGPLQASPYDKDGKYTLANGDVKTYPKTLAWLTLSYGGSVAE
jgi:hypothetical protein